MRDAIERGGGGGGASEEADSEEEESSSSLRSRIGDTVDSARDRVSDTIGSDDDDESEESTDSDTQVRETSREAADEEPEPQPESETDSEESESSDQSESEDRGIRDRAEDVVDRGREIAEDPRGAVEDAADTVRDAPEEIRDRASEIDTGPSVDAGSIEATGEISSFEADQVEDQLRSDVASELDDVDQEDVMVERGDDGFRARVEAGSEAVTVAELTEEDFQRSAAEQMDQVGREDVDVEISGERVGVFADEGVQEDFLRQQIASDDPRVDADDVDLEREGDQFDIRVTDESAQRLESGVSGTDARNAFGSFADGFTDSLEEAGDAFAPMAAGAAFEFETARRAIGNPGERLPGVDSEDYPDSVPDRARSTEETAPRDELREQVAEESEFDEDEIAVGFDVSSGQLEASPTDDAIENRVREEVAEEEGIDPDRVMLERDGDEFDIEIDREAGVSGIFDTVRGEQSTEDLLIAEDERWRDISEELGDEIRGEDPGNTRQVAGDLTQEFSDWVSPAGTVLFAEDAVRTPDERNTPLPLKGADLLLPRDGDQERVQEAVTDFRTAAGEDPVSTGARTTGAVGATLLPIGIPRVAQSPRGPGSARADAPIEVRTDLPGQRPDPFRDIDPSASTSDLRSFFRDDSAQLQFGQQRQRQRQRDPDPEPTPDPTQRDSSRELLEGSTRDQLSTDLQDTMLGQRQQLSPDVGSASPRRTFEQRTGDTSSGGRSEPALRDRGSEFRIDRPFSRPDARAIPTTDGDVAGSIEGSGDLLGQSPRGDTDVFSDLGARMDTDLGLRLDTRGRGAPRSSPVNDGMRSFDIGQSQPRPRPRPRPRRGRRRIPQFDLPDEEDDQSQFYPVSDRDEGWVNPIERLGRANQLDDEVEPPEEGQSWRWF